VYVAGEYVVVVDGRVVVDVVIVVSDDGVVVGVAADVGVGDCRAVVV